MPMPPPPDPSRPSLAEIARAVSDTALPPVARWNPAHCGDSGMRIAADGRWWHEGGRIERAEMVRLFSRLLRREADGGYVLVTPVEKLAITVDDRPFLAVAMTCEDGRIGFVLNSGDAVIAGPDHPIRLDAGDAGPRPLVQVRDELEARLSRPVYYELAELALEADPPGVTSDGCFFPFGSAE